MRGKLWFLGGLAAGFVLGARAGREKYEELMQKGRQLLDHPTVQEAAGVAQSRANRLYQQGKERLSHTKLGEKVHMGDGGPAMTQGTAEMPSTPTGGTTPAGGSTGTTTIEPPSSPA
jgi:hypothetical protein